MKTIDLATSREKRKKHVLNIAVLTILWYVGLLLGRKYDQGNSPYMMAYALPSLVAGIVFCKRFSDIVWMKIHPHSIGRVNVYHYGANYEPAISILGIVLKYMFYMVVGFVIFPVYSIWAVITVVRLSFSIYRNKRYCSDMIDETIYDQFIPRT